MTLLGHHSEAFFKVEIMGHEFPTGMVEHGIGIGLAVLVLGLVVYGAYAALRDLRAWRQRRITVALPTS